MSDTTLRARLRESDMWWSFCHSPLAIVAAIVTLLFFLGAIFAPWVAPFDPFDVKSLNLMDAFTPPAWSENGSARHLLGTDNQGRDVPSPSTAWRGSCCPGACMTTSPSGCWCCRSASPTGHNSPG